VKTNTSKCWDVKVQTLTVCKPVIVNESSCELVSGVSEERTSFIFSSKAGGMGASSLTTIVGGDSCSLVLLKAQYTHSIKVMHIELSQLISATILKT